MKKICFISSDGGHLDEMKEIFKRLNDFHCFFVTYRGNHLENKIKGRKTIFLPRMDRNIFKILLTFFIELVIFLKEKPKIIITSGAGLCIPMILFAKIFGSKTIYIETMSRIKKPSLTGKIVYKMKPNLFFIQWEHHKKFFPDAIFGGALF